MYMVCIYYDSSAPKGMSIHTESVGIKTCQSNGREVRKNASEADERGDEVAELGCPRVPWSSPQTGEKQLSPTQGKCLL